MREEIPRQLCTDKNIYVAFKVEDYAYAIFIKHVKGIVGIDEITPYVIPPKMSKHVKGMIKLNGKLLTVIELVKTSNNIFKKRNQIIILNYMDKDIGILAYNIHLINASIPEVFLDKQKVVYDENGEIYTVFDIFQCDKYVGV